MTDLLDMFLKEFFVERFSQNPKLSIGPARRLRGGE